MSPSPGNEAAPDTDSQVGPGKVEFVILMALMTSLVALSIDGMLPALPAIGADMGVADSNRTQWVVSMLFLGLAGSQMVFGPLSDSFGRKGVIYVGFAIFMAGCVMAIFATSFTMLLTGRLLQGIGAAGPRTVSIALVRDRFEGREMARVMSLVMTVFILVPVFAPAIGQVIMNLTHWRGIFVMFLVLAVIALIWFWARQPETLRPNDRHPFSVTRVAGAMRQTVLNRTASGYTLTAGLIFGAFLGYLISAQQVFQVSYGVGDHFPFYFGMVALSLGCASLLNAKLVMRFGMRRLTGLSLIAVCVLSIVFLIIVLAASGLPPLWSMTAYFLATFFFIGFIFGNFNALAMEPLGHIAGSASSVIASMTLLISLGLGTIIGQAYDGTILPLIIGFALLAVLSLGVMVWVERGWGWMGSD